jgi:BRCA1-associated protein
MQLGNNRVWDYAGDNYVHRLLQNKSDGKMVQVDQPANQSQDKVDSLQLEYTYLLTNQLETQRTYFEDALSRRESETTKTIETLQKENHLLSVQTDQLKEQVSLLTKEKQSLQKKLNQVSQKMSKSLSDLEEERTLNKCLRDNQEGWNKKVKNLEEKLSKVTHERDKEIDELKEQVRDLMFFLEAQNKLKNSNEVSVEEIQESTVIVSPSASSTTPRSKTRTKKR